MKGMKLIPFVTLHPLGPRFAKAYVQIPALWWLPQREIMYLAEFKGKGDWIKQNDLAG